MLDNFWRQIEGLYHAALECM